MTNGDKIRSMSDEELAEYIVSETAYQESAWSQTNYATGDGNSFNSFNNYDKALLVELEWLKKEAE